MLYPYPTEFPLEDVLTVIQVLRGGNAPSAALIAKHLWVLTGYFLRLTLKEPVDPIYAAQSLVDVEVIPGQPKTTIGGKEDAAALLESMVIIHKHQDGVYVEAGVIGTAVTIGGTYVLTQLAKILLPYLLKWLVEYLYAELVEKDRPLDDIIPDGPILPENGFIAKIKKQLEERREDKQE